MNLDRRTFMKGVAAAGIAGVVPTKKAQAVIHSVNENTYASLIDLSLCDGCAGKETPACVNACHEENRDRFPEPDPAMLKNYWPQKKFEDWSQKRGLTTRLTPYNWIFVQSVEVEYQGSVYQLSIPRRCMHCDSPPCAKLCPFGALSKSVEGPVYMKEDLCFGGAKCRTVCPWDVPQRQAGVGLYTHIDPLPVGGGQMFKCDLCKNRLKDGKIPACMESCPNNAMFVGKRGDIFERAEMMVAQKGGFLYGDKQNGGTSTLYYSPIPFDEIDKAIVANAKKAGIKPPQTTMRLHNPENMMASHNGWATAALIAPVAGILGAFATTVNKKEVNNESE